MTEETTPQPSPQAEDAAAQLAALQAQLTESQTALAAARGAEAAGVTATKEALRAAHPHLRADAIDGSSIAELQTALATEKAAHDHYKAAASTNGHLPAAHVPAGGTPAPAPAPTTAFEKIRAGLAAAPTARQHN